jgi:hypothetical protein
MAVEEGVARSTERVREKEKESAHERIFLLKENLSSLAITSEIKVDVQREQGSEESRCR